MQNVRSIVCNIIFYLQALMDHGTQVAKDLASAYVRKCSISLSSSSSWDAAIELGLRLGKILCFICF
jgi:hypothetical protein